MKLKNGDEIEVGGERYRVILDELFLIKRGMPPIRLDIEIEKDPHIPLCPNLISFYEKKGYDVCPRCGGDRNSPGGTGCGKEHYGTYCWA